MKKTDGMTGGTDLSKLTDEQLAQQVGSGDAGENAAQGAGAIAEPTPVDPKPAAVAEVPKSLAGRIADVIRREEHDLTRMIDEAKGWSEKEGAMFLELVERRLQSMEARLAQLEVR